MRLATVEKDPPRPKLEVGRRTGGGPSGGFPGQGGPGGFGDRGDRFPPPDTLEPEEQDADKARIITWFLLIVVLMTFGGLIGRSEERRVGKECRCRGSGEPEDSEE